MSRDRFRDPPDETPPDETLRGDPSADAASLAELTAAWRALESPAPTAALDDADPETLATIEWLRAAWQVSEPPTPSHVPWRVRARPTLRRAMPWLSFAAAAAMLLLSRVPSARRTPAPPIAPREVIATGPDRRPIEAPNDPSAEPVVSAAPPPSAVPPAAPVITYPDRMELRSGNVRLILFTPIAAPPARGPSTESS
ncbi:MAG: hypothetical protein EXS13_10040 [Planctomycetes bacterium]|nr:hypothetical protein [Planctomycetota bacterium]